MIHTSVSRHISPTGLHLQILAREANFKLRKISVGNLIVNDLDIYDVCKT